MRAGQALCALGQYDSAVQDLRQAVSLSPESEKDIIREKLAEAKQKQKQASQGGCTCRLAGRHAGCRAYLCCLEHAVTHASFYHCVWCIRPPWRAPAKLGVVGF